MINDVCGAPRPMLDVAAEHGVPVVAMHMRGEPRTMQAAPHYDDVVGEVAEYLASRLEQARERGVSMIVDPGIGFGKTLEHNLSLLRGLDRLVALGAPVLVGVSRKSFLGKITGQPTASRVEATVAANVLAVSRGAHIVRVHDVAAHVRALAVADAVLPFPSGPTALPRQTEGLHVEGLVLESRIGVLASERQTPQGLIATIEVDVASPSTSGEAIDVASDEAALAGRLDYVELATVARQCAVEREWRLVESLAAEIAKRVERRGLDEGVDVRRVRVKIVKSAVAELVGAGAVGVEVVISR